MPLLPVAFSNTKQECSREQLRLYQRTATDRYYILMSLSSPHMTKSAEGFFQLAQTPTEGYIPNTTVTSIE